MAKQTINTGTTNNDGTGDTIRAAGIKINENFTEVYDDIGALSASFTTLNTTVTGLSTSVTTLTNENHISSVQDDANPVLGGDLNANTQSIVNVDSVVSEPNNLAYLQFIENVDIPGQVTTTLRGTYINVLADGENPGIDLQGTVSINGGVNFFTLPTTRGTQGQIIARDSSTGTEWVDPFDPTGYATEQWVIDQGFLVAGDVSGEIDLTGYATEAWVNQQGFLTSETDAQTLTWASNTATLSISNGNDVELVGVATQAWVNEQNFLTSETDAQTLSWVGNTATLSISNGNEVVLSGFATEQWVIDQGYLTVDTDAQTLTWLANTVSLQISNGNTVELVDVATQTWVNQQGFFVGNTMNQTLSYDEANVAITISDENTIVLTGVATEAYVDTAVSSFANTAYVDTAVSGLASESYVDTAVANVAINDLTDVDTTSAQIGSVLKYNGTNWVVGIDDSGSGGSSTLAGLTDVNTNNAVQGSILAYNNSNSTWEVNTSATSSIIAPVAFGFVNDTANGTGTGISWGSWNSGNSTLDFTFDSAQADANYAVITDSETFDDYFVGITNKTTTGFRAEFYDNTGSRTPSSFSPFTFVVYASTPTVNVFGEGAPALNDITDLTISSATQGDVISYEDGSWANRPLSIAGQNIADLADVDPLTPSNGDVLTWDTSGTPAWKPAAPASTYSNSDVDGHLNTASANTGQILSWDGADYVWVDDQTGSAVQVAGANTQIQFNNSGVLGASVDLTFNDSTNTLSTGTVEADTFISTGTGTPNITSSTDIELLVAGRVKVTSGFLRPASLDTTARDAITDTAGDIVWNNDVPSMQISDGTNWFDVATTDEKLNAKTSATGTVDHDISLNRVFDHSSLAADFTANFTNVPSTQNVTTTIALVLNQGATAYIPTAVQLDGVAATILWQGGSVPTGTDNGLDIVSFTIIDVAGTKKVIGSLASYS